MKNFIKAMTEKIGKVTPRIIGGIDAKTQRVVANDSKGLSFALLHLSLGEIALHKGHYILIPADKISDEFTKLEENKDLIRFLLGVNYFKPLYEEIAPKDYCFEKYGWIYEKFPPYTQSQFQQDCLEISRQNMNNDFTAFGGDGDWREYEHKW